MQGWYPDKKKKFLIEIFINTSKNKQTFLQIK